MKFARFLQMVVCCVIVCAGLASGDSLELRNGRHVQGKYIGGTTTAIGFMTSGSVEYFSTSDILSLIFDNNPDASLNGLHPNGKTPSSEIQGTMKPLAARKAIRTRPVPRLQRTATQAVD